MSVSPSGSRPVAVNATLSGALPELGAAFTLTDGARLSGSGVTVTVTSRLTESSPSPTVTSGVYVPTAENTWLTLAPVASGCPSRSKSHWYVSVSPSASVATTSNCTLSGTTPDGGVAVADWISGGVFGASDTVTVTVLLALCSPSETVTFAAYVPGSS